MIDVSKMSVGKLNINPRSPHDHVHPHTHTYIQYMRYIISERVGHP